MSDAPETTDGSRAKGSETSRFDPLEHFIASKQAPKSVRRLPHIARSAIGLAREASPSLFVAVSATQFLIAGLLGLQVLFGKLALEAILTATNTGGSVADALPPLVGLIAAGAVSSVATAYQAQAQRLLGELVQRSTLDSMLAVATTVDLETFESPVFFDDLQRVQTSALIRPLTMAQGLVATAGGALGVVGLSVAILALEPLLLPVLFAAALPLWLLSRRQGNIEFAFNVTQTPGARLRAYLVDTSIGRDEAKELRAFALGPVLRSRWRESFDAYMGALRGHVRRRMILALLGALATVVVTTAAFALLISFVLSGRLGLASAGAAVLAIRLLGSRIQMFFNGLGSLFESSLFLEDLARFLARAPSETSDEADAPVEQVGPFEELRLEDVHFGYPGAHSEALRGVSLQMQAGEVIALVGENGSGKTTLAKLVGALFTPTGGRILWDGRDVATLDRRGLRRQVGVIFQDFVRYQLTAQENIGFGRVEAIDDKAGIAAAAHEAGAGHFLEQLPQSYGTMLGKIFAGGYDLSIGQWQRVALARAFFRESHLLILDEPTASLDARSEHELFEYVRKLAHGRTVLLISHRFSTVKSADRIYVLHAGEIVEEGTHEELMEIEGRYAELFELQAGAYR